MPVEKKGKMFSRDGERIFRKQITRSLNAITARVQTEMKLVAPVGATGFLRNSIGTEVSGTQGTVFVGAEYAESVNNGRRAAPVGREADTSLIRWLTKSTKGRDFLGLVRSKWAKKASEEQVIRSALFILKRSMKKRKREGQKFFEKGINASRAFITKEIERLGKNIEKDM